MLTKFGQLKLFSEQTLIVIFHDIKIETSLGSSEAGGEGKVIRKGKRPILVHAGSERLHDKLSVRVCRNVNCHTFNPERFEEV